MNPELNPAGNMEPMEIKIVGYCRACGKGLDAPSAHHAFGTIYCEEHLPKSAAADPASPWTAPGYHAGAAAPPPLPNQAAQSSASPGLAFILGFIPGVGAIYNGQYAKGFIHVVIFGLLVSIMSSGNTGNMEPLFGLLISGFVFYMAFEAHHTAKKRNLGQPVEEWSGLTAGNRHNARIPVAPILLIVVGAIFLLNNLGLWDIQRMMRYWPALLIVMGIYMLWNRITEGKGERQ